MIRPLLIAVAALALAGCLDGPGRVAGPSTPSGPVELTRITPTAPSIAYYSGLGEPTRLVISDAAMFTRVWEQAFASVPVPSVDFGRERVIVAALGQRASGGYAIEIQGANVEGDEMVFDVVSTTPGDYCAVSMALTQPVDMVKVPRSTAAVRFAERSVIQTCAR